MRARSTIFVFCSLLLGIALINIITPSRSFSEQENRYLKQLPNLTFQNVIEGRYTQDLDEFIVDQFVWRDGWIGVKTTAEHILGRGSSNGIYFAKDDYLIEMFDQLDHSRYMQNLNYVQVFSQTAEKMDIPVYVMLIPTASHVLTERIPAHAPEVDQMLLLDQARSLIPGLIDSAEMLQSHSDEYIYYRTDHHWTSLGAFYAYNAFRTHLGLPQRKLKEFSQHILSDEFYGTNWSRAGLYSTPPDTIVAFHDPAVGEITVDYNMGETITDTIYERSYLMVKDKYSVFLNANQPLVRISTEVENGRRLLVIKDSFFNTFAQMLLNDYEEIIIIDLRYFKASLLDYMQENEISEVLILYNLKGFGEDANLFYLSR